MDTGTHDNACPDDWGAEDDLNGDDRSWYTGTPDSGDVTYQSTINPLF